MLPASASACASAFLVSKTWSRRCVHLLHSRITSSGLKLKSGILAFTEETHRRKQVAKKKKKKEKRKAEIPLSLLGSSFAMSEAYQEEDAVV